jgi:hypothetical protein
MATIIPGLFSTNTKTLADRRYISYSIHLHGIWHDWSIVDLFGDILKCLLFFEVFFIWKYIKILYNFLNIIVFGQSGNSEYSLFPCPTLKIGTKNEHLPTDIHDSSTYSQGRFWMAMVALPCLATSPKFEKFQKITHVLLNFLKNIFTKCPLQYQNYTVTPA